MGTKDTRLAHGASSKKDVLLYDPENVKLVTDPAHPLYQATVHDPIEEPDIANVMAFGILEPIIVAKDPETGETLCVAGRTRTKWCREANRRLKKLGQKTHMLPATVKRGEMYVLTEIMVSENAIRREYTKLERAREMQKLVDMNRPLEEIAVTFGLKSPKTVKDALLVLDATKAVRDAVGVGDITFTQGAKLAKLPPEEQREKVAAIKTHSAPKQGKRNGEARKRAAIVDGTPQHRPKREIVKKIELLKESDNAKAKTWLEAIEWTMGEENALCTVLAKG